ncbi:MAG TPA: prepilin-type N-terminal cleavage/methylation domain-containing protein, partial [Fibrobacteria bacterium]|nr:prepilin-type N-terminal cleavage/methylation domain-containing protein [Fibrobacteria bacterium]
STPRAASQAASQAGFSLLEAVVSMVILGLLSVSVFYFLSSQNGIGARGNDRQKGLNLGKLAMDSLKVSLYDSLSSGSDTIGDRYIRSWHISVGADELGVLTGRKKIDLTVLWPLTAERQLTFTSILGDPRYKEAP